MKRGQEVKVSRVPAGKGYVWEGYWQEDPNGIVAIPIGRIRKVKRYVYEAEIIWLSIGGYLIL